MDTNTPSAEQAMAAKHQHQMQAHEARFGKLGELQTQSQKRALSQALAKQKR